MSSVSRTILRKSARAKMEFEGNVQVAKKKYDAQADKTSSFFQRAWKEYAPHKVEEEDAE